MCNIDIAKTLLKRVKRRTERDLYLLEYGSLGFNSIDENNFHIVEELCKKDGIVCPIHRTSNGIRVKCMDDITYNSLKHLASKYSLVFDLSGDTVTTDVAS